MAKTSQSQLDPVRERVAPKAHLASSNSSKPFSNMGSFLYSAKNALTFLMLSYCLTCPMKSCDRKLRTMCQSRSSRAKRNTRAYRCNTCMVRDHASAHSRWPHAQPRVFATLSGRLTVLLALFLLFLLRLVSIPVREVRRLFRERNLDRSGTPGDERRERSFPNTNE